MIITSDEWVNLHKEHLLPETFVEIRLDVTDLDVTDLITVTGKNQASFSNADSIVNVSIVPPDEEYALLEYNLWTLDGSKTILSDVETYEPPGFVSKDDTSSGLTISLSEIRSSGIPGFTITWSSEYDEYATDFKIEVKNGDTILGVAEITDNNSTTTVVDLDSIDYDKVVITVNKWSVPEHRIRIDAVAFGRAIIFDKNQILSYSHEQTGDPLGSEISKNSIQFSVDNTDGRWDLLNPSSMEKYLYERQPLRVRYGMRTNFGVEWIQAGVFYLTEWRAPSNGLEATFVARDAFEFMLNTTYRRTSYDGVIAFPSSTMHGAAMDSVRVFSTKEGVWNATGTVTATLPIGTNVKVYEHSVLYSGENPDPFNDVILNLYRIDQGWIWAEAVEIVSDTSMLADMREAISSSTKDISLTWVYGTNLTTKLSAYSLLDVNVAEFVQKCVNKCGYAMWQKADGKAHFTSVKKTLSDYVIPMNTSYSHPEVELMKPVSKVDIVAHCTYAPETKNYTFPVGEVGDVVVIDNPYVTVWDSDANSLDPLDCARGYVDWYKHRGWVSGEFRADPRLELFDVVRVESKYGVISPVMITRIKYTYNGSFRGEYKGKILSTDLVDTGVLDDEVTSIANS